MTWTRERYLSEIQRFKDEGKAAWVGCGYSGGLITRVKPLTVIWSNFAEKLAERKETS